MSFGSFASEAYYIHIFWMSFIESKETEKDIERMFHKIRENMKQMIVLKNKSDPGKFVIPCMIGGLSYHSTLCDTSSSISIMPKVNLGELLETFSESCQRTHTLYLEHEDDGEASIYTQPEASIDTPASLDYRKSFAIEAATSPRRMICVVQPDEYGVYKNKEGNAKTMYERIINVSKEDIEAILEVADTLGGRYQSLPQYERCFEMPRVHPTPPYLPEANTYTRDLVKDLIENILLKLKTGYLMSSTRRLMQSTSLSTTVFHG
ncbi:hypothetical protein Bca4012_037720 [Brassica carinata]